jgi:hypothetical protein
MRITDPLKSKQSVKKRPCHGREQAHRHDQHHGERPLPAFVLSGQDQENEERGRAEHQQGRRALLLLLEGEFGLFEADAMRKNLMGEFLHAFQRGARRDARRGGTHDLNSFDFLSDSARPLTSGKITRHGARQTDPMPKVWLRS